MMPQLLVLAAEDSDLHHLCDKFASQYRFATADVVPLSGVDVDLFVVEAALVSQYARVLLSAKQNCAPQFVPVLVIADQMADWQRMGAYLGETVDDVLVTPLDHDAIGLSIRNLLFRRDLVRQLLEQTQALSRINLALESTSDAISISDQTGATIYQNQSFSDLYGFDIDDMVLNGMEHTLIDNEAAADEIVASLEEDNSWQNEIDLRCKDGRVVPTFMRANPIRDGNGDNVGAIFVYTDMSDRRRAEAAEQEQHVFAEALRDTSAALTSTLDLDSVLDQILSDVRRVVPHDAASIMLVKEGTASIVRSHGYQELGIDSRALQSVTLKVAEVTGLRWMVETGQPLIISDAYAYVGWFGKTNIPWLHSYIGVPILLTGATLGFLNISSLQQGIFDGTQATRLQLFAEQAAIALQNAQLHEKALTLAAIQERQRLARELHDGVNQMLFSASMISESLLYPSKREPEYVQKRLTHLHRLTRGALVQMRMLLAELRPEELIETSLSDLVKQLVDAIQSRTQLQVDLTIEGEYHLPDKVQVAYYYITLELLNNIASHARAKQIKVLLKSTPHSVQLTVQDDGNGFDIDKIAVTQGGISIIDDRVSDIGATLEIVSHQDVGTEVTIRWRAIDAIERTATHGPDDADTRADR